MQPEDHRREPSRAATMATSLKEMRKQSMRLSHCGLASGIKVTFELSDPFRLDPTLLF
jgi:hypothetical protein